MFGGAHIYVGAVMVVMGARCSRGCRSAGSIPAHGSNKTNEEVLAKLLTWGSRPGETSSSQGWWENPSALFHFRVTQYTFLHTRAAKGEPSVTHYDGTRACRHFYFDWQSANFLWLDRRSLVADK